MPKNKNFYILVVFIGLVISFGYFATKENYFNSTPASKAVSKILNSPYNKSLTIGDKRILVEVVSTAAAITNGLSGRESIEGSQGMFFDFGYFDTYPTFWMKDMQFAIDIIWINDGKIVHIDKNVQTPSPDQSDGDIPKYSPPVVVDYVLEVRAEFSEENNITIGDLVDLSSL